MTVRTMGLPALALGMALAGCLALPGCEMPPDCTIGSPALTVNLFFGRERPHGAPITDAEWNQFLAEVVTPRFPEGLTVTDGRGQWRNEQGVETHEASTVVTIVTDPEADTDTKIDAIRHDYRRRFDQQSVGVTTNESCADF